MSALQEPTVIEEPELYPNHEEDSLPEHSEHEYQVRSLRTTLRNRLPERWVTGDVCMYWIRGDTDTYRAPDVLVVERPTEDNPDGVYKLWRDALALLVVEVSSKSTKAKDEGPKVPIYLLDLNVQEYLYFDRLRPRIRMWRLHQGKVTDVSPQPSGRFASETLGIEFGIAPDGRLRIYEADGTLLPTAEEEHELLTQERQRAEALERELERLKEELLRYQGPGAGSSS